MLQDRPFLYRQRAPVEPLTRREGEVLDLLARRLQDKEIGVELFISPETVKSHLKNIYGKLEVGSRGEAVERAVELELLYRSLC